MNNDCVSLQPGCCRGAGTAPAEALTDGWLEDHCFSAVCEQVEVNGIPAVHGTVFDGDVGVGCDGWIVAINGGVVDGAGFEKVELEWEMAGAVVGNGAYVPVLVGAAGDYGEFTDLSGGND